MACMSTNTLHRIIQTHDLSEICSTVCIHTMCNVQFSQSCTALKPIKWSFGWRTSSCYSLSITCLLESSAGNCEVAHLSPSTHLKKIHFRKRIKLGHRTNCQETQSTQGFKKKEKQTFYTTLHYNNLLGLICDGSVVKAASRGRLHVILITRLLRKAEKCHMHTWACSTAIQATK